MDPEVLDIKLPKIINPITSPPTCRKATINVSTPGLGVVMMQHQPHLRVSPVSPPLLISTPHNTDCLNNSSLTASFCNSLLLLVA